MRRLKIFTEMDEGEVFNEWNNLKKSVQDIERNIIFFEQEIWILSLGKNIGIEINGKGENFIRPVLIYKKFNRNQFLMFPLTTKGKHNIFYHSLSHISFLHKKSFLSFSQIRVMDKKRLIRKIGKISDAEFESIKKSARAMLEPRSPNGYNVP